MPIEKCDSDATFAVGMEARPTNNEQCQANGRFVMECLDKDGKLLWREEFDNVVCTVGKNLALDTYLAGSAYTVVGPFMGLIGTSGGTFTGVAAGDTMSSHAGWFESTSGVSTPRKTPTWSAASGGAKATTTTSFTIGGTDTLKGAFLVYGSGAVNTVGSTAGTLYSAGQFSGGDQPVVNANVVNVSYSTSL